MVGCRTGLGGCFDGGRSGDGAVIGTSRFDCYDPAGREVEIGWTFLARSHWGGAYNAEMKRLMLEHAFTCVDAVVLRAHAGNVRSQRAIEKLGAVRIGSEGNPHGRGHNHVFRLDRSTFNAAEHPLSRQSPAT